MPLVSLLALPFKVAAEEIKHGPANDSLEWNNLDGAATPEKMAMDSVPSPEFNLWPSQIMGVRPDPALNLPVNNIGVYRAESGLLYSCVRIVTSTNEGQIPVEFQLEVVFAVDLAQNIVLQVLDARDFNPEGLPNDQFELPDCSGLFDMDSGTYIDAVQAGQDTYAVTFKLSDMQTLQFRALDLQILELQNVIDYLCDFSEWPICRHDAFPQI